jgi:myo-inositol-1-phosphate synthase
MQAQVQSQTIKVPVKTSYGEITVEVVKIEKRYNIKPEEIPSQVKKYLFASEDGVKKVLLYSHDTWGSCREWKSIVLNSDGSYIDDGEWINQSSRKNAHKYKVMKLEEFLEKYRGKELIIYVHESPSCNKSKEFSFRAVVRIQ